MSTTTANIKETYDLDFVESAPHQTRDQIFRADGFSEARSVHTESAVSVEEVSVRRSAPSRFWGWLHELFTPSRRPARPPSIERPRTAIAPGAGPYDDVMLLLAHGKRAEAWGRAADWHRRAPGDVLALVALGHALEATGDLGRAARAYGSLIDLDPGRAELRRFAGENLEHLPQPAARELAIDAFRKAAADRPDHPSGHRLLAMALLRAGRFAEAFHVLETAVGRGYPPGRFAGVDRVLREDLGLVAAAWIRAEPGRAGEIRDRLAAAGGLLEDEPSLRFVVTWESDASDVDLHVWDRDDAHAYFQQPQLPSGGSLYADVTTGYGPECFTVRDPRAARAYPYLLRVHYFNQGPAGHGMGKLEVIDHDGHGDLRFEERAFVIEQDRGDAPDVVHAALANPAGPRPVHP